MVRSSRGASYALLEYAQAARPQVELIISDYVILEARDVFTRDGYRAEAKALHELVSRPFWQKVTTSSSEDYEAAPVVSDLDDAPIVAAARKAGVDALVSFDRKHLHTQTIEAYIGAPVMTAGDALAHLRAQP